MSLFLRKRARSRSTEPFIFLHFSAFSGFSDEGELLCDAISQKIEIFGGIFEVAALEQECRLENYRANDEAFSSRFPCGDVAELHIVLELKLDEISRVFDIGIALVVDLHTVEQDYRAVVRVAVQKFDVEHAKLDEQLLLVVAVKLIYLRLEQLPLVLDILDYLEDETFLILEVIIRGGARNVTRRRDLAQRKAPHAVVSYLVDPGEDQTLLYRFSRKFVLHFYHRHSCLETIIYDISKVVNDNFSIFTGKCIDFFI